MISTQYINLNMVPSGVLPVLYCSQYDVGRPLGVVVYNGSESVDLSGYTCTIEATRTDKTPVTAAVTTSGNIGVFATTATMTNKKDKYLAKLVLFDSDSRRVASLTFVLVITPATMDEDAESIEEDASLYQQYTGTVQTLIAKIREDLTDSKNHLDSLKNQLMHNIFIDDLVLDGTTDNTQKIVTALGETEYGIFVIPYNCVCDRDTITNSLDPNIVVIDPYYSVVQGDYVAKYFKLLTAKNDANNDSVVVVEDFHHPCLVVNNRNNPSESNSKLATIGFANGYNENNFLKFTFMISQSILQNHYVLLFRRMTTISGELKDATAFSINELGQIGFNTGAGGTDYDYIFRATDRRPNKDQTLIQIGNEADGRSGIVLMGSNTSRRLDILTDPSLNGVISYANGSQIKMDANSIMFDTNEKIGYKLISGAIPSLTGRYAIVQNSSATTMTGLTSDAGIITLMFTNNNTTVKSGNGITLKGNADWNPHTFDSLTLIKIPSISGNWIELNRNEMGW